MDMDYLKTPMETNFLKLEIKVMFAKNLWTFNFFQKLTVYAAAFLSGDPDSKKSLTKEQMQEQRTPPDPDGDGNPDWNHSITFDLSSFPVSPSDSDSLASISELLLRIELRHQTGLPFLPDKTVGDVKVPIFELLEDSAAGVTRFVDYQVRSPDGKPNGVLRFAYKVPEIRGVDGRKNSSSGFDRQGFGISGYTVITDQNRLNSVERFSSLYPRIDSSEVPSLFVQAAAEANPTSVESYPPTNPTNVESYPPPPNPTIVESYPPPPKPTIVESYPPPPNPTGVYPSDQDASHYPPPYPHHYHHPPPPPPFFHHQHHPPPPPPPPPPANNGYWGRPPGSQWYRSGSYNEHYRRGF